MIISIPAWNHLPFVFELSMLSLFAQAADAAGKSWYESGVMEYMLDGGPFMWPILIMAVLALGVIIERFRSLKLLTGDARALRAEVLSLLHEDRVEEALALCSRSRGPVPAILAVGLHRYEVLRKLDYDPAKIDEQVVKAMDDYAVHIAAALEKHLPILATISNVAPMVGSIGTVVGMVILFKDIAARAGTENIVKAAAAGIQVKLLVTVFGLMVGVPAYIFYNYFTTSINQYILEAEETASQLIEALTLRLAAQAQAARSASANPVSA